VRNPQEATALAERADLEEALAAGPLPLEQRSVVLLEESVLRARIAKIAVEEGSWKPDPARKARLVGEDLTIPRGLPPEFSSYLRGAIAYHRGDFEEARSAWEGILARPEEERRYRSTWAAFMVGKTWLASDPAKAVDWFRRARELAARGFVDRLGLATASYGWEAMAERARGRVARAIELYLQQVQNGYRGAFSSIRLLSRALLREGGTALSEAAASPTARSIVTAYLLCFRDGYDGLDPSDRERIRTWLEAVRSSGAKDFSGADRLAWLSYMGGDVAGASRWLEHAAPDSPVAQWVRARLALRHGKTEEAARLLADVVRLFPEEREWRSLPYDDYHKSYHVSPAGRALGELGSLRLSRRQFAEALDALLRSGYWLDAAYVAERVLTTVELQEYVQREWGTPPEAEPSPERGRGWGPVVGERATHAIRYLLARRLAREGRLDEARKFLPASLREKLGDYIRALEEGREAGRSEAARAEALWKAARIARHSGMELFGTEIDPDWSAFRGSFHFGSDLEGREKLEAELLPMSAEEGRRARAHAPDPEKRFHYRYLAGRHALEAAQLLPADSEEAARILCLAGSWIEKRDPPAADRFYKLLVRRCGGTELGKEADRLRWFPKIEDPGE
jgi:hypothetical protein